MIALRMNREMAVEGYAMGFLLGILLAFVGYLWFREFGRRTVRTWQKEREELSICGRCGERANGNRTIDIYGVCNYCREEESEKEEE
jgi:hypothetical protein